MHEYPWIERPINIDYGTNVKVGSNVFINFNCTILDTCTVSIGSRTLIGPNVSFFSGTHPVDPDLRNGTYGPEMGGECYHRPGLLDRRQCHHPAWSYGRRWLYHWGGECCDKGKKDPNLDHGRLANIRAITRTSRLATLLLETPPEYCARLNGLAVK